MSRIDDIVASLCGSQNTIDHLLTADERKDPEAQRALLERVHEHIAVCNDCDFWFELEELNMHSQCESCVRSLA